MGRRSKRVLGILLGTGILVAAFLTAPTVHWWLTHEERVDEDGARSSWRVYPNGTAWRSGWTVYPDGRREWFDAEVLQRQVTTGGDLRCCWYCDLYGGWP